MRHYEEFKSYLLRNAITRTAGNPRFQNGSHGSDTTRYRKMPPERKKLLDEIGFVWSVYGNGIPRLSGRQIGKIGCCVMNVVAGIIRPEYLAFAGNRTGGTASLFFAQIFRPAN